VSLRLYDTARQEVRDLEPLHPGHIGVYHCGLTVQGAPHLGHIRKEVVFDVLRRWLEHRDYRVTVVGNVTDIDDKILSKAQEKGVAWFALAYENERALHAAYEALGCRPPTYEPRATGVVPEMVEMMERLVESGHAYPAADGSGDVYFDVRSWPAYGELSRQRIDDMEPAQDADPRGKRDPRDFALWKGAKDGEPESASWPTPWGRGRPGWHLECSALVGKYLGDEFDIHGGGLDLRFPHHENELAQSRAAGRPFARLWMHNAMLNLDGEKMSKSVGNTLLVSEVVKRVQPASVRYYLAVPHYRSVVDFSEAALAEADTAYRRIEGFVRRAGDAVSTAVQVDVAGEALPSEFTAAMDDDLSTPAAVAVLQDAIREGNRQLDTGDVAGLRATLTSVRAMLDVLGLDPLAAPWSGTAVGQDLRPVVEHLVEMALEQRAAARARRDFAASDAIRDQLKTAGVVVEDTPSGARFTLRIDG